LWRANDIRRKWRPYGRRRRCADTGYGTGVAGRRMDAQLLV